MLEEYESRLQEAFHAGGDAAPEIKEDQVYVAFLDELYHRVRVLKRDGKWVSNTRRRGTRDQGRSGVRRVP